eukprot:COSAG02_NODE_4623_length_5153_cov_3.148793_5_plen_72_part_00
MTTEDGLGGGQSHVYQLLRRDKTNGVCIRECGVIPRSSGVSSKTDSEAANRMHIKCSDETQRTACSFTSVE